MKKLLLLLLACAAPSLPAQNPVQPPGGIDDYPPGPDSMPQKDVPKGKTFSFGLEDSKIFPGTRRNITVYVPAQYKGDKPACVYVGLDGLGYKVPVVFDNLIHKGDMPVTIAVGISSGTVPSANGKDNPRFNRSFEFDGLNDALARFVTGEIFPEVEKRKSPDGLPIRLSTDPNDRCAGGGSTGGIAAFSLAWQRPDQFRRVFSAIGTFVGMRGGDRYMVLVRKHEPKPIRVFLQDGLNDQWGGGPEVGDWWMGNVTLQRALEFAGYDQKHVWGTGPHSGKHGTAVFPDAMRFLWKDWPAPVVARKAQSKNVMLKWVLDPDTEWKRVDAAGEHCDRLVANPAGDLFFQDSAAGKARVLKADGNITDAAAAPATGAFGFSADGSVVSAKGIDATCLIATHDGAVYATEAEAGKVWRIAPGGTRHLVDEGLQRPTGIAMSPDGLWLAVMESRTHWGYSYRVQADGSVDAKQRFYWAHVPDWADDSGAGSLCMDRDGRPYLATHMGVQVFDRNGRSRLIMPMPEGKATHVCFGGARFDTLFVISGGKLYQRHMKAVGVPTSMKPIKLPGWGGG